MKEFIDQVTGRLQVFGTGVYELPDTFDDCADVTAVYIGEQNISRLPPTFSCLAHLRNLIIYDGYSFTEFPSVVGTLVSLVSLEFSGSPISIFPDVILNLRNLTWLRLAECRLESIPDNISALHDLQILDLDYNRLASVPTTICTLTKLTYLSLGGNRISEIPDNIGNLTNLESLALMENNLHTLPESIGCMQSLKVLGVYSNPLSHRSQIFTHGYDVYSRACTHRLFLKRYCAIALGCSLPVIESLLLHIKWTNVHIHKCAYE